MDKVFVSDASGEFTADDTSPGSITKFYIRPDSTGQWVHYHLQTWDDDNKGYITVDELIDGSNVNPSRATYDVVSVTETSGTFTVTVSYEGAGADFTLDAGTDNNNYEFIFVPTVAIFFVSGTPEI